MKQRYFYLTIFAALMATFVTGCKKEEGTVTLGAVIQKPANNKVYIDDHTPCWHNDDEVYINNTAYPVMAASGATARIENVTSASAYRAIFPASIVPDGTDISSGSTIPVTLPATQQYQLVGNYQLVDVPMGAYIATGSTLQFYNLCSIVRVIVSNSLNQELPLRSIELQAQTAKLSGAGTATVSGQASDCITLSSNARNSVNLAFTNDCPATVEARGTSTFDIVVPAFSTNNVTISLYTTDGYMFSLLKEGVSLEQNTITTVTLNVTSLTEDSYAELVDGPTFKSAVPRDATSIVFEYNSSVTSGILLSTNNSPVPIYGNMDGTVWRISTSASKINANPNCSNMFNTMFNTLEWEDYPYYNLNTIDFGTGFNTENVTDMSYMFSDCWYLSNINNLSCFNTENVTNMSHMFYSCQGLASLDLSSFNTENVTNMSYMFSECSNLTSLDLSNFNTENVTNMSIMFSTCYSLTSLDLSNFNTENVTNMNGMFFCNENLTSLDLSNFNTENVTDMGYMFHLCSRLTSLDLSNFDMSSVTEKMGMCYGLSYISQHCTITCPMSVQIELEDDTGLYGNEDNVEVTITWVRP